MASMGGPPALPGPASANGGGGGLITWIYDNPRGVTGDTLMVTFDDGNNGAVTTVRVLGLRPYPAMTRGGIRLGDTFARVLARYGYPDMTMPMDYNHTAVYYFNSNVAFGFQGNGPSMRVDSITIGIGEEPQAGATATGARPAMGGMMGGPAGYPGMGGRPGGMGGPAGYPGMGGPAGYPGMGGRPGGMPGYPQMGPPGGYPGMAGPARRGGGKFGGMMGAGG
jgi:hypothetical protein